MDILKRFATSSQSHPSDHAQKKLAEIQPVNDLEATENPQEASNTFSVPLTYNEIFIEPQAECHIEKNDFSSRIYFSNDSNFGFVANSYSFRSYTWRYRTICQHTNQCPGVDPPVIYQVTLFNASKAANESSPVVTYQNDRPFQFATRPVNQTTQTDITRPNVLIVGNDYEGLLDAQQDDTSAKWAGPVLEINFVGKAQFTHTVKKGVLMDEMIPMIPKTTDLLLLKYVSGQSIILKSHHLLRALEALVGYYPSFRGTQLAYSYSSRSGETHVRINEPYAVVMHHFQSIKRLVGGEFNEPQEKDSGNIRLAELPRSHMKILYEFAKPLYQANVIPCEQHLSESCPQVGFDMVWYLLKPGTNVYVQSGGMIFAGVIVDVAMQFLQKNDPFISGHSNEKRWWSIKLWHLKTDGTRIRRTLHSSTIDNYSGLHDVTKLSVCPVSIWDAKDNGKRRMKLLASRKTLFRTLRQGNALVYHDGPIQGTSSSYTGRVVLDYQKGVSEFKSALGSFVPVKDHCEKYRHYDDISIYHYQNTVQELTEHQLLLLHPKIPVYRLKLKQWMVTSIDYISEIIQSSESLSDLIMGEEQLQIIRAVSHKQDSKTKQGSAYSIEGKRSGQIILLHGPPGLGKTYTVEVISKWLHRPLLVLKVVDIGTNATRFKEQLVEWFNLAEAWNAVLLVDEFDVFLEWPQEGLRLAFLRRMEYFKGLLFLTTNRVSQIDDTFISQVNVAIVYNTFNSETRKKIWNRFFQELEGERAGKIQIALEAKKWALETTGEGQAQLNGRDIRNALQTAISLAHFESEGGSDSSPEMIVVITKDHLQKVLEMSTNFRKYMTRIREEK